MNQTKVSIIMPVYKVEEYVGKAIESIQAQTLKEWEFLIVDDGTPDRSGEICDEYAKNDNMIGQNLPCWKICITWQREIIHSLW